jgi:hypothetical protein
MELGLTYDRLTCTSQLLDQIGEAACVPLATKRCCVVFYCGYILHASSTEAGYLICNETF